MTNLRISPNSGFKAALVATFLLYPALGHADTAPKPGTIEINANGNAKVAPDTAIISLSVVQQGDTARQALSANNAAMAGVLKAMKGRGIEDRDLQTASFNIQPRYVYPKPKNDGQQSPPYIAGYTVSNSLTVRVRDLNSLGDILDDAVTLGVNSGGDISFTNDNPSEIIKQARKNAMANALEKAKTLAEAAGVKLGRILKISEQGGNRPRRAKTMAVAMRSASAEASVPVASGENAYSVTVNVRWEIAQ